MPAPILAGIGLWRAAPRIRGRQHWLAVAAAAVVAAMTGLAGVLVALDQLSFVNAAYDPVSAEMTVMIYASALIGCLFAVLGVGAARAIPGRYGLPEILVASGALLAGLSSTIDVVAAALLTRGVIIVPWGTPILLAELTGIALLALGFFSARVSVPAES